MSLVFFINKINNYNSKLTDDRKSFFYLILKNESPAWYSFDINNVLINLFKSLNSNVKINYSQLNIFI